MLAAIVARREYHLDRARTADDPATARSELAEAEQLQAGPDIARLRACHCLRSGDFAGALAGYFAANR